VVWGQPLGVPGCSVMGAGDIRVAQLAGAARRRDSVPVAVEICSIKRAGESPDDETTCAVRSASRSTPSEVKDRQSRTVSAATPMRFAGGHRSVGAARPLLTGL
jgi:hypothetical protein